MRRRAKSPDPVKAVIGSIVSSDDHHTTRAVPCRPAAEVSKGMCSVYDVRNSEICEPVPDPTARRRRAALEKVTIWRCRVPVADHDELLRCSPHSMHLGHSSPNAPPGHGRPHSVQLEGHMSASLSTCNEYTSPTFIVHSVCTGLSGTALRLAHHVLSTAPSMQAPSCVSQSACPSVLYACCTLRCPL